MFNDISQVVYFHYPRYVRDAPAKAHELADKAVNALACIGRVIPQVNVVYDDERCVPLGRTGGSEWQWVVSLGIVYLWDPKRSTLWRSSGMRFCVACVLRVCFCVMYVREWNACAGTSRG